MIPMNGDALADPRVIEVLDGLVQDRFGPEILRFRSDHANVPCESFLKIGPRLEKMNRRIYFVIKTCDPQDAKCPMQSAFIRTVCTVIYRHDGIWFGYRDDET